MKGVHLFETYWAGKHYKLRKQSAGRLFRNKFYCGWVVSKKYPGEEVKGQRTPMVSEKLFYKVQGILDGKRTIPVPAKRTRDNPLFPLKGIVRCHCGSPLVAAKCKGRSKYYLKYWCPSSKHKSPTISVEALEGKMKNLLSQIQPCQEAVDLFTLILHKTYNERLESLTKAKRDTERKILRLKEMMSLLVEGHLKGKYPDEIFDEQKAKFEDQILAAQIVKNDSICKKYDIEAIVTFIKVLLTDLTKAYEVSNSGQKRVLLGSIFPSGAVFKNGKLLNRKISPIFRQIQQVSTRGITLCEA